MTRENKKVAEAQSKKPKVKSKDILKSLKLVEYIEAQDLNFENKEEVKAKLTAQSEEVGRSILSLEGDKPKLKKALTGKTYNLEYKISRLDSPIKKQELQSLFDDFQREIFVFNSTILELTAQQKKLQIIDELPSLKGKKVLGMENGLVILSNGENVKLDEEESKMVMAAAEEVDKELAELQAEHSSKYPDYGRRIKVDALVYAFSIPEKMDKIKTVEEFEEFLEEFARMSPPNTGRSAKKIVEKMKESPEYVSVFLAVRLRTNCPGFDQILELFGSDPENLQTYKTAMRDIESRKFKFSIKKYKRPETKYQIKMTEIIIFLASQGIVQEPTDKASLAKILTSDLGKLIKKIAIRSPKNFDILEVVFSEDKYKDKAVQEFILVYLDSHYQYFIKPPLLRGIIKAGKLSELTGKIRTLAKEELKEYLKSNIEHISLDSFHPENKRKISKLSPQEKMIIFRMISIEWLKKPVEDERWRSTMIQIRAAKELAQYLEISIATNVIVKIAHRDNSEKNLKKITTGRYRKDCLNRLKKLNIDLAKDTDYLAALLLYKHPLTEKQIDVVGADFSKESGGFGKRRKSILIRKKIYKNEKISDKDIELYRELAGLSELIIAVTNDIFEETEVFSDKEVVEYAKKMNKFKNCRIVNHIFQRFIMEKKKLSAEEIAGLDKLDEIEDASVTESCLRTLKAGVQIDLESIKAIMMVKLPRESNRKYEEIIFEDLMANKGKLSERLQKHLLRISGSSALTIDYTVREYNEKREISEDDVETLKKISRIAQGEVVNDLMEKFKAKNLRASELHYCIYISVSIPKDKTKKVAIKHLLAYLRNKKKDKEDIKWGKKELDYLSSVSRLRSREVSEFMTISLDSDKYHGDINEFKKDYPTRDLQKLAEEISRFKTKLKFKKDRVKSILAKYSNREHRAFEDMEKKKLSREDTDLLVDFYQGIARDIEELNPILLESVFAGSGSSKRDFVRQFIAALSKDKVQDLLNEGVSLLNALHDKSPGARTQIRDAMHPIMLMAGVRNSINEYSATDANSGALLMEGGLLPSTVQHSIDLFNQHLNPPEGKALSIEETSKRYRLSPEFVVQYLMLGLNSTNDPKLFETYFLRNSKEYNKALVDALFTSISTTIIKDVTKAAILQNGLVKLLENSKKNPEAKYILDYFVQKVGGAYESMNEQSLSCKKATYKMLLALFDELPTDLREKLKQDDLYQKLSREKPAAKQLDFNMEDPKNIEQLKSSKWYTSLLKEDWQLKAKKAKGRNLFSPTDFRDRKNPGQYLQPLVVKVYDVQEGQNITNNIARLSGDGRFTRHYKRKKGYGGMGYKVKYIHENKDWKPSLVVLTKRSSSGRLIIRVEQTAEPKKLDLKSDMEGDAVHKIELSGHVSQTFRAFKSNSMYKANPNMTKFIADRGCGNAYRSHGEGRKMGQSTQVVATNIKGENYKQNVIFVLQEEILADAEGGRISHAELRRKTEEALRRNGNKRGQGVFGYYEGMLVYGDTEQAFAQRVGQIIDEALKPRTL